MAKGNDGNYLQHSIEVNAAMHLSQMDTNGRLHIALTHGMAPFERFEKSDQSQTDRKFLVKALKDSSLPSLPDESMIVTAYRKTDASNTQYPNSVELLKAMVGVDKLSGGIAEKVCGKHKQLVEALNNTRIKAACSSWRNEIRPPGVLSCPDELHTPWLFTMDPMTYMEIGAVDDANLYYSDLDSLSDALSMYVRSGKPGIATLFVYNIKPTGRNLFWKFIDDLAESIGTGSCYCWLTHRDRKRNLAGVLYTGIKLSNDFLAAGINLGKE